MQAICQLHKGNFFFLIATALRLLPAEQVLYVQPTALIRSECTVNGIHKPFQVTSCVKL